MRSSYKGLFKPVNPSKYKGDPNKIVYRSLLEKKFFKIIDENPAFKYWASEEFHLPYISPIDNRPHRYFIDLFVEMQNGKKILIEIKPHSQTLPPKAPKNNPNKSSRYLNECATYAVNDAKWKATRLFCKEKGLEFMFLTEKQLPKALQ